MLLNSFKRYNWLKFIFILIVIGFIGVACSSSSDNNGDNNVSSTLNTYYQDSVDISSGEMLIHASLQ